MQGVGPERELGVSGRGGAQSVLLLKCVGVAVDAGRGEGFGPVVSVAVHLLHLRGK